MQEPTTNDGMINGHSGTANMTLDKQPRQLRSLFDAEVAGKDAAALGRVARLLAQMSPDGQRAALCWLIGYFDANGNETDAE